LQPDIGDELLLVWAKVHGWGVGGAYGEVNNVAVVAG